MASIPQRLDHLVYAVPDLASGIALVEQQLGVRLLPGGRHAAWHTANAILPIGKHRYLEVIGPDPEAAGTPTIFELGSLKEPRLVTWCARGTALHPAISGSRVRPDGLVLRWTLTDPFEERRGGVLPFFIDWGDSPHPSSSALVEVELRGLTAEHPDASRVREELGALGLDLEVRSGKMPRLRAAFDCRGKTIELS